MGAVNAGHLYEMMANALRWEFEAGVAGLGEEAALTAAVEGGATVIAPVAVFAAMLAGMKHDFEAVEELIDKDNFASGFSQGAVMRMLDWEWRHVNSRFVRHHIIRVYQRERLNEIRVVSYNLGLMVGYKFMSDLGPDIRQAYLKASRKSSGADKGNWDERAQINYVIAIAAAFRKRYIRA